MRSHSCCLQCPDGVPSGVRSIGGGPTISTPPAPSRPSTPTRPLRPRAAVRDRPGAPANATFWVIENEQIMDAYTVSLDQGCLFSWHPNVEAVFDPTADPITDEEAVERAKEIAERHLGEAARDLIWEVEELAPDGVRLMGQSPPSGDPPRLGLGPWCEVYLLRPGGVVRDYFQQLPESTEGSSAHQPRAGHRGGPQGA